MAIKKRTKKEKSAPEVQEAPVRETAEEVVEKAPAATPAPASKTAMNRSGRSRGRIPPRVEAPKSRQKDSTEQNSLMKPFYLSDD